MSLLSTLLAGVLFGLALAAPPGPMNAVIAEESVQRGWTAGFRAGLGAMTADLLFFALAAIGAVTMVRERPPVRSAMFVVGGGLMLYFAYGAAHGAAESFRGSVPVRQGGTDRGRGRGFTKAFLLALTNPYQVLFWLTVGIGLLTPGSVDVLGHASDALAGVIVVETGHPVLVAGLFGGVAVWIVGFPAALNAAERRVEAAAPAIGAASAAVLAAFGLYFLANGLLADGLLG